MKQLNRQERSILTHKHEGHHEHEHGHQHDHEHEHQHNEESNHSHNHEHSDEHDHEHFHYDWEEPGYVSLWLGNIKSEPVDDILIEYLQFEYDGDESVINPPFCSDFEITEFAEDFREAGILDEPKHSIEDMLTGCSYDEEVIPLFQKIIEKSLKLEQFNTIILLYNFNYHGKVKHVSHEQMDIVYVGSVQMQEEV